MPMRRLLFALAALAVLAAPRSEYAQEGADPNQELYVTPAQGPWMIFVTRYAGPEGPTLARQFLTELRANYKVPAYLFAYGAEEKRKEDERVRQLIKQQRDYLNQMGLSADTPIRVPRVRIQEEYAVLVGGYKDMDAARRDLEKIKKMPPPNPGRVRLDLMVLPNPTGNAPTRMYDNPFMQSFVVHNPTIPVERPADKDKPDAFLKQLNVNESFSLLKCPKPVTLVVKQYQGATVVQSKATSSSGFLQSLGLGGKSGELLNAAALNAHNLAEVLRKLNFDAYVLHTRYSSIVTVGGYDGPEDPRLKRTQQQLASLAPRLGQLQLFTQPMPMEVPRP
jgi:hypothetical protein